MIWSALEVFSKIFSQNLDWYGTSLARADESTHINLDLLSTKGGSLMTVIHYIHWSASSPDKFVPLSPLERWLWKNWI